MSDLEGAVVEDRFVVEQELGAGAMAVVYRGRHVRLGRPVALKVLHHHLLQDEAIVARFEREARLAARLHHPNVAAVIDLGQTPDGRRVIVLEHAPGRTLAELVGEPMPRARVVSLVRQLLRGLEHAHAMGLVHRDLKPENVIVEPTPFGEVARIVDFGIAVLREPGADAERDGRRLTTAGTIIGTPAYMSPEQAHGDVVDHRSDLFALGVVTYELLAGRTPFRGDAVDVLLANVTQDPPPIGGDACPRLEMFARTLMKRDASERYQTAYDALVALDRLDAQHASCACAMNAGDDDKPTITRPRLARGTSR